MKWIRWVLKKIQSGHDSVHRRTDGQGETSILPFNFVERVYRGYKSSMAQIMSGHRTDDKQLPEPMMTGLTDERVSISPGLNVYKNLSHQGLKYRQTIVIGLIPRHGTVLTMMTTDAHPDIVYTNTVWNVCRKSYVDLCARSRYQGQGQVITSHRYCGM